MRKLFLRVKILKLQYHLRRRHVQRGGRVLMWTVLTILGMANLGEGGGMIITSIKWMIGDDDGVRYIISTEQYMRSDLLVQAL